MINKMLNCIEMYLSLFRLVIVTVSSNHIYNGASICRDYFQEVQNICIKKIQWLPRYTIVQVAETNGLLVLL